MGGGAMVLGERFQLLFCYCYCFCGVKMMDEF